MPVHDHLERKHDVEQRSTGKPPKDERVINLLLRGEQARQAAQEGGEHGKGRQVASGAVGVVLEDLGCFGEK